MNRSVKRIIALTALWLCAAFAIAQAPIGVCLNNVAQTISNGVIAPIPYATVALCTPGSTAANCVANKVSIYTSTALSTATPTNPFTADAGGNYFFCAQVGHYGLLINSSYGQYFVPDVTLDDDWSKGGTMTGALTDTAGFIGPLTGNAATASASDHSPTQCGAGLYSQGDSTTWAANCAQVLWSQIGSIPSFYYQTVQAQDSAMPQEANLDFADPAFVVTDSSGNHRTAVNLRKTGVQSSVVSAAGPGTSGDYASWNAAGDLVDGGARPPIYILARWSGTSCTMADDGQSGAGCEATQSWGVTLPSTYYWYCSAHSWSPGSTVGDRGGIVVNTISATTTTFTYNLDDRTLTDQRGSTTGMDCWATN